MTAVQQPVATASRPAVRQRIDWIDTAKGLCMILVIVGHTLPYGNLMRNFIFSFHMPAFFFLTGYTARRPDTWQGFARRVKKDFAALIVPVLGVVQVFNVLLNFFLSDDRSLTNLWDIARYNAITLFWASGNPADGRTVRVETTLSLAVKPVINAVEMRQSPKPRGLKMGVIRLPTKARRLESGVAATFRRVSNVCRNQITTVATKIIVKAR